jgi:C1A family cysteine protease
MNKVLILSLLSLTLCLSQKLKEEKFKFNMFQNFVEKYNKKYSTVEEYMARFRVFKNNLVKIFKTNENHKLGINQFADMTENEFRRKYLNLNINVLNTIKYNPVKEIVGEDPPEAFNWLDKKVLTAVKNQGSCGSCWAFSAVGNIEALYAIKYGENKRFSEQQLVDCDTLDEGCNGGLMEYTFQWIIDNGGITLEDNYKYVGYDQTCKTGMESAVSLTGFDKLESTDEEYIKKYLYNVGPLAIAINADPFQFYFGGIIDKSAAACDPEGLNHGVVLVGYGHDDDEDKDYWLIRNSWGASWGEKGYVRVARGKGVCGVNTYVTSAQLK